MKPADLKKKNSEELAILVKELREEKFKLGMLHNIGQLEKTHRLTELRRDVARVLTILDEKKREAI